MPPMGARVLPPPFDRTRYDGFAPRTPGHLLMDHLDDPASCRWTVYRTAECAKARVPSAKEPT